MMTFSSALHAENLLAKEYFLKAAFLYNFARMVEWPTNAFTSENDPIRLCFLGDDPFDEALSTIENKKVKGRSLLIYRDIALSNASKCHILFISKSEKSRMSAILATLGQHPVLTVSELPGFVQEQGHIRLFLADDETLSLEVNLDAIIRANLQISSRILLLAKVIRNKEVME